MANKFSYKCNNCGQIKEYKALIGHCLECGSDWLDPVYDLQEAATIWKQELSQRDSTIWRYWELLPVLNKENIVSIGEGWTPLLRTENLGSMLGHRHTYIKDERQGPTASFKDRQASLAISVLKEADIRETVHEIRDPFRKANNSDFNVIRTVLVTNLIF